MTYRFYLNVSVRAHMKALIDLLTSSHTLTVEVLRWYVCIIRSFFGRNDYVAIVTLT